MRTEFLCISVLRVASGPRVKLVSCKSILTAPSTIHPPPPTPPPAPHAVYSTADPSKAVVPMLVLLFICFVVYSTKRFVLCIILCFFVLVFLSPFSIAITSLGEERANLSAFRTFVRFALVWFCLFPLPFWCLVWAAVCDCGTPWTFLLPFCTLLTVLRRWSRFLSYSLLLSGLSYEAICFFMSYLVLSCSCVFQSFQHDDYLAWGRES